MSKCHSDTRKSDVQHHKSRQVPACHKSKSRPDYLLWVSMTAITILYIQHAWFEEFAGIAIWYETLSSSVYELINTRS